MPEPTPPWRLRPALPADEPFLKALFAETNATLRALPPEWREGLADVQYRGRQMTYAAEFPGATDFIILSADGTAIGRQLIHRHNGRVRVVDIALLQRCQGKRIGTSVLQALMRENTGAQLALRVTKDNPAFRLYQRLGFHVVAEDEIAFELVWDSGPPALPPCNQQAEV